MVRKCKICKRFVANGYGYCGKCWDKLSECNRQDKMMKCEQKRGIYRTTLDSFK